VISFCVFSQKGGSAKTTSAMTLADALSRTTIGMGKSKRKASVLLIDADPQRTAYKWESRSIQEFPRFPVRVEAISNVASVQAWHQAAIAAIEKLENLDYLVIDTPPVLKSLELSAVLQFADIGIMPFQPHVNNVEALEELVPYLNEVQAKRSAPLDIRLLVTMYALRRSSEREIYEDIENISPWPVLNTRIKNLVPYSDAANYKTSLYALPGSKEARRFADDLAVELLEIAANRAKVLEEAVVEEGA
jgi:chromosome partitioning protein